MPREPTKIWTHFDKKANTFAHAICKYCKLTLSYRTTIGNLSAHLKRSHYSIYYADWRKVGEDIEINTSVASEENSPLDVGTIITASTYTRSSTNQATDQLKRSRRRQKPINKYTKTLTPEERKPINQDPLELFITTYEPFKIVRSKRISDSVKSNPDYSLLPRKTIPALHQGTDTKFVQNEKPTANSRNLFCICCLQTDTPLINLYNCNHSDFLDQFSKPELNYISQVVCSLCHTVLKKIKLFKAQVENSFKIISDQAAFVNNTKRGLYNLKMYKAVDILISEKQSLKNPITISVKGNLSQIKMNCSQNNNAVKIKNISTALDIINKNNQSSSLVNPFIQTLTSECLTNLTTALTSIKKNSDNVDLNESENMRSEIPTTAKQNIKANDVNLDLNIEPEDLESDNVDKNDSSENLWLKNAEIPVSAEILNLEFKNENLYSNVENAEILASGTKIKDENIDSNIESENLVSHNQHFGSDNLKSENPKLPGDMVNTNINDESADLNIKTEILEFDNVEPSDESSDSILSEYNVFDSMFESTDSNLDFESLGPFKSMQSNVESEILESDKTDISRGVRNTKRKTERSEVESENSRYENVLIPTKKIKLESTDEAEAIMQFDSSNEFEQEQEISPLKQETKKQVNTIDLLEQETNELENDLNHFEQETNQLELEINHLEQETNELEEGTSRLEKGLYKFPTESNNSNQELNEGSGDSSKVDHKPNQNNDKPNKVDQETNPIFLEQNQIKQEPNLLQYDSIFEEETNNIQVLSNQHIPESKEIKSEIDLQLNPIEQESNLPQKYLNNIVLVPEQKTYQQKSSQLQLETNQHEQQLNKIQPDSIQLQTNTNKMQQKLNKMKGEPSRIQSKKSRRNKLLPFSREVRDQIVTINISLEELNEEREKLAKEEGYLMSSFKCKRCILGFNFEENLMDHIRRKHTPSGDKTITCEVCSELIKGNDNKLQYDLHKRKHFVRHACTICSKRFVFYEDAQKHVFKAHKIVPSISPASS